MARIARRGLALAAAAVAAVAGGLDGRVASGAAPEPTSIVLAADRDDDDANGVADGTENELSLAARVDLVPVDRAFFGATFHPLTGGDRLRVVASGRPVPWSSVIPAGAMFQGLTPGVASLVATRGGGQAQVPLEVQVIGAGMRDGAGKVVDLARDHASLERTPPARVVGGADALYDDPDELRVVLQLPNELATREPLTSAMVASIAASGETIDVLRVALSPVACDPGAPAGLTCAASAPLRFVIDEVDQKHPLVRDRSLRAEVGGAIAIVRDGRKVQATRVLGPRASSAGPIGRLRATLRPVVLRVAPGSGPAIGGTDAGAIALLRGELALASAIWGQCGVTFGPAPEVRIMDPPPAHLLALGDDLGLPASGGELRFRVDGHELTVPVSHGMTPSGVADAVARALERVGLVAVVSPNARIAPGASGSVDVSVRKRDGRLTAFEPSVSGAPLSSDPTFVAVIGSVDLSDGLQHFGDMDSVAGTLEERTLLKAVDDGDPRTIDVIVVPLFAGGGRIGESFIASDLSSVRNAVILDRAGIRARRSSLTLAHELGHVLMDLPGHPDDYGVDTPTQLMDSDGSDASPFGPRRLTVDECARVVRQAGPSARLPLLTAWPLAPIRWVQPIVPR